MKKFWIVFLPGLMVGALIFWGSGRIIDASSSDKFCNSCHIHPQAEVSWKKSVHYITKSGVQIHCVDCHLPPKHEGYLPQKIKTGVRDVWSQWFRDSASFNWQEKSQLDHAINHVFETSCSNCHTNLFPPQLTKKGENAHLYYIQVEEKGELDIQCINCHLNAGHYDPNFTHDANAGFGSVSAEASEVFTEPIIVKEFQPFTEKIPGSSVSFNMIAIPGGKFTMGGNPDDPYVQSDELPAKEVQVSPFFMAEIEVSWDEYMAFYAQTAGEGRSTDTEGVRKTEQLDAIVGATPPYGQPDQGWGRGKRPAISISYHAAETYCKWLTSVSGKNYRLPTEAEWEYAARAGSTGDFFFDGSTKQFLKKKLFSSKRDTSIINSYVVYAENSKAKTQEPDFVMANPFGLKNMLGNVAEFCSDWYAPEAYKELVQGAADPKGPATGKEHVVRGGSYKNSADMLRLSDRDFTRTNDWLKTDPQIPKSIWWYSDCFYVGFRVVCEFDEKTGN